jgi:hypothetical protein
MSAGKHEPELDPAATLTVGEDDGRLKLTVTTKYADVHVIMSPEQAVQFASTVLSRAGRLAQLGMNAKGAIG